MGIMGRPSGTGGSFKRKVGGASTDSDAYCFEDSGCVDATLFLKEQGIADHSLCLECPFPIDKSPCYVGKKKGPRFRR